MKTTRRRCNGFTLIEILTVLGIIIVLGALSFSVFARVREKGRSATCQSNLKQIGLAMQQCRLTMEAMSFITDAVG
jgi:type II secretory pathway pseudopilin PulG